MTIGLVITAGYLNNAQNKSLENDRLLKFYQVLKTLRAIKKQEDDQIVVSEFGESSKLRGLCDSILGKKYIYVFSSSKESIFNQAEVKNAGAEKCNTDVVLFINSDVVLSSNVFDVLRQEFEKNSNIFCTCARTDVFIKNSQVEELLKQINKNGYPKINIEIDDPGWQYVLKIPQKKILSKIKIYEPTGNITTVLHDFRNGYINYGEFIALSKEVWNRNKFDKDLPVLTDSYIRDKVFHTEKDCKLVLVHDKVICCHLSGSDFMGQEINGSEKDLRLKKDLITAANKYEYMKHWLVFSYRPEFDNLIDKLKIPFKEIWNQYSTEFSRKYFKYNEEIKKWINM